MSVVAVALVCGVLFSQTAVAGPAPARRTNILVVPQVSAMEQSVVLNIVAGGLRLFGMIPGFSALTRAAGYLTQFQDVAMSYGNGLTGELVVNGNVRLTNAVVARAADTLVTRTLRPLYRAENIVVVNDAHFLLASDVFDANLSYTRNGTLVRLGNATGDAPADSTALRDRIRRLLPRNSGDPIPPIEPWRPEHLAIINRAEFAADFTAIGQSDLFRRAGLVPDYAVLNEAVPTTLGNRYRLVAAERIFYARAVANQAGTPTEVYVVTNDLSYRAASDMIHQAVDVAAKRSSSQANIAAAGGELTPQRPLRVLAYGSPEVILAHSTGGLAAGDWHFQEVGLYGKVDILCFDTLNDQARDAFLRQRENWTRRRNINYEQLLRDRPAGINVFRVGPSAAEMARTIARLWATGPDIPSRVDLIYEFVEGVRTAFRPGEVLGRFSRANPADLALLRAWILDGMDPRNYRMPDPIGAASKQARLLYTLRGSIPVGQAGENRVFVDMETAALQLNARGVQAQQAAHIDTLIEVMGRLHDQAVIERDQFGRETEGYRVRNELVERISRLREEARTRRRALVP